MDERAAEFASEVADRHGIDVTVEEFPEGTETAAEAADVVGCDVAQVASSLVFVADGAPVVVVTSGANRVSERRLADLLDAGEVRMANPEEVAEATGYEVGGVAPLCHDGDPAVYMDETLLEHEAVWAAAGTATTLVPVDPERLRKAADATAADVTG